MRIDQFLKALATPGSRMGGGSVSALSAALSAALLEKLACASAQQGARLCSMRQECQKLVLRDAEVFGAVMKALRSHKRAAFVSALKRANAVQWRVFECSLKTKHIAVTQASRVKPALRSDLFCAAVLADSAACTAETFIRANTEWLNDHRYAQTTQKRFDRLQVKSRVKPAKRRRA